MKNIFEILKHEEHKLEIIKTDKDIQLGCIECGCKLISFKEDLLTEEFCDMEKNIKDRRIGKYINQMYKEITHLDKKEIEYLAEQIINETSSSLEERSKMKNFIHHPTSIDTRLKTIQEVGLKIENKYGMIINFHKKCKEIEMLKENIFIVANQLENKIIEIIENNESSFIALRYKEEYLCSYHTFKNMNNGTLLAIKKEILEKVEKESPTIKEIIEINNIDEYCEIFPDFDEEEEETYKYRKFIYLSREGLLKLKPEVEIYVLEDMLKEFTWLYDYGYIDNRLPGIESARQVIEKLKKTYKNICTE